MGPFLSNADHDIVMCIMMMISDDNVTRGCVFMHVIRLPYNFMCTISMHVCCVARSRTAAARDYTCQYIILGLLTCTRQVCYMYVCT